MPAKADQILLIQTAFIGDAILASSMVETLAKTHPNSVIDIILRQGNEGLYLNHPKVRDVLIWNKKKNKYRHLFHLISTVRKKKYTVAINLQRFFATGLMTVFSGASKTIGFKKNPLSILFSQRFDHDMTNGLHEIERNHSLIASWTQPRPEPPRLYPSKSDYKETAPYIKTRFICIAPTSVWFTKQFPAHKWIDFIASIPSDIRVYLLGGPGDYEACEFIKEKCNSTRVSNLAGKLTLMESAALMKRAAINAVNDSAPMHLASAMNAPTVAVFCSTVPSFGFGPLAAISTVIETKEKLHCRPCGLHGKNACPIKSFECAESIEFSFKSVSDLMT